MRALPVGRPSPGLHHRGPACPAFLNPAVARWFMTFEQKPLPTAKHTLTFGVRRDPDRPEVVNRWPPRVATEPIDAGCAHRFGEDTKRQALEKFDAVRWTYWEVVAWVCYREPSRLHDLWRGLFRYDRLYDTQEYQADKQVRLAIRRAAIKPFYAGGKPVDDLGSDASIFFSSAAIKARYSREGSLLATPQTARTLDGGDLDQEIRSALRSVIEDRKLSHPNDPLHGKDQATRAMALLRELQITAKHGSLRKRVDDIADKEFKHCRRPQGVRKSR